MDLNRLAARIVREATDPEARPRAKDEKAVADGQKGGKARAARMTPEERSAVARRAARARWGPPTT
jgi:hypothetical protein